MTLLAVGLSHRSASMDLLGKVALPACNLEEALATLVGNDAIFEAVIVSTCNRTEVYASAVTAFEGVRVIVDMLRQRLAGDAQAASQLVQSLVIAQGPACIEHLFCVSSSLDSMVVGEGQIAAQVRRAFAAAQKASAVGEVLVRLFRCALETGKQVREKTGIAKHCISVSTAALQLAERSLGSLAGRTVVVVGAGQMGQLALAYLKERKVGSVVVANRSFDRASRVAKEAEGRAISLDQLKDYLPTADLVLACATGPEHLIEPGMLDAALARRPAFQGSLVLIDVGVPPTIDPACKGVHGVLCSTMEDIHEVISQNTQLRAEQSLHAKRIVSAQTDAFLTWLQERQVEPTVKQIHEKADRIGSAEQRRAQKALATLQGEALSDEQNAILEAMSHAIVNKLLHGPCIRLRKQLQDPDAYRYTEAARFLFGLDAFPQGFSCRSDEGSTCRLAAGEECARHGGGACPHHRGEHVCTV